MKRKKAIPKSLIFLMAFILIVILIPFPLACDDGGTIHYNAILYQYVSWHKIISNDYDEETGIYNTVYYEAKEFRFFPFNWIEYLKD